MSAANDPTSEQFGPYEVYDRLGLGGMATVYRAKKRGPAGFERSVALKRMLQHLAEDPAFVGSFIREAKVASLLQHPNIAQVYDFGRISGVYYIAMELVSGFDIRKLLRYANRANEAIPMQVILSILGEMCDALDYAHTFVDEAGHPLHIVHRDVSPSNLIVAHTGHLKVIDFGIAKASSRSLHTESGQVKGKLGYMSPEVALGMAVGPVSDIFSVGVVAWELVTASPLFSARTDFETMRRIREEPIIPPSRFNPACPARLDQMILAALQRDADQRLASARLFRNALDEIALQSSVQVSARAVAEWMLKFAQPEDTWARSTARARSPSSLPLPLPAEPPTAVHRTAGRAITQLQRSPDDIQLAAEIWGEEARTVDSRPAAAPDFHRHVSTPAHPPELLPPPIARRSQTPLAIAGALALIAIALGGVLLWKRSQPQPAPLELPERAQPTQVAAHEQEPIEQPIEQQPAPIAQPPVAPPVASIEQPPVAQEPTKPAVQPKHEPAHTPTNKAAKRAKTAKEKVQVAEATEPTNVEPPKPEPPKPELPKPEPPKPVDVKPARTPLVAASAVTKLSGDVPTLRAKNAEGSGDVLGKICIDDQGKVSSVTIKQGNPEIISELTRALSTWRYKPYVRDGKASPVCFPLSLRVVVKSS